MSCSEAAGLESRRRRGSEGWRPRDVGRWYHPVISGVELWKAANNLGILLGLRGRLGRGGRSG